MGQRKPEFQLADPPPLIRLSDFVARFHFHTFLTSFFQQYYVTYQAPEPVVPSSYNNIPKKSNRSNPIPGSKSNRSKPPSKKTPEPSLEATIQAGIPLSKLNLHLLDTDTKLILAEKEQALLASHETIKILQMKTHRLEQLLSLKEKRIEELKRKLIDE